MTAEGGHKKSGAEDFSPAPALFTFLGSDVRPLGLAPPRLLGETDDRMRPFILSILLRIPRQAQMLDFGEIVVLHGRRRRKHARIHEVEQFG